MPDFILVAHGSPSDPEPPDVELARIAARVSDHLGAQVRSATLAKTGSLAAALEGLRDPVVYPFLMAEGWFTRSELPRRLVALGAMAQVLRPLGTEPALKEIIAAALADAEEVIVAAHGSRRPGRAKETTHALIDELIASGRFRAVHAGFIEEAPFIADVARSAPHATCLPFFALRAGHVDTDIPAALAAANFKGQLLPAVGELPAVPEMIARSLRAI